MEVEQTFLDFECKNEVETAEDLSDRQYTDTDQTQDLSDRQYIDTDQTQDLSDRQYTDTETVKLKPITSAPEVVPKHQSKVARPGYFDDRNLTCDRCEFRTKWKSHLSNHIKSKHEGVVYQCQMCDYRATLKTNLKKHVDARHLKVVLSCEYCTFKTNRRDTLKNHVDSRHQMLVYTCDHCEFKTAHKWYLKRHIDSQHKGIMLSCDWCEYKTGHRSGLRKHVNATHRGLMAKCELCPFQTADKHYIKFHMMAKHQGIANPKKVVVDPTEFMTSYLSVGGKDTEVSGESEVTEERMAGLAIKQENFEDEEIQRVLPNYSVFDQQAGHDKELDEREQSELIKMTNSLSNGDEHGSNYDERKLENYEIKQKRDKQAAEDNESPLTFDVKAEDKDMAELQAEGRFKQEPADNGVTFDYSVSMSNNNNNNNLPVDSSSTIKEGCDEAAVGRPLCCNVCGESANTADELAGHVSRHVVSTSEGLLKCHVCTYTSRSSGWVRRHVETSHGTVPPTSAKSARESGKKVKHHCDFCNFSSSKGALLRKHTDKLHTPATCVRCGHVAEGRAGLRRHVGAAHGGGGSAAAVYSCGQCDYTAAQKCALKLHVDSKHEGRAYSCERCDFRTPWRGHLKNHVRSRHEGVVYECSECDYKASLKVNLNKHVKAVHVREMMSCDHCDYQTPRQDCLKKHMDCKHRDVIYSCNLCEYKTAHKWYLKQHTDSMHKGLLHNCDWCEYKTGHKSVLKNHINAAHKGIKACCQLCQFKTSNRYYLKFHIMAKHQGIKNPKGTVTKTTAPGALEKLTSADDPASVDPLGADTQCVKTEEVMIVMKQEVVAEDG